MNKELTKESLKTSARNRFKSMYVGKGNPDDLRRIVRLCNGEKMARWGEQLSENIVNEVFGELKTEFNF